MINIVKSDKIPPSLSIEKAKPSSENYRCEGVITQLVKDFHNKCYICEDYGPSTLNTEHFKPHKGDRELMFAWENLFLACGHCNNQKSTQTKFNDIVDCTNPEHPILEWIKFEIKPFPKERTKITALSQEPIVTNTVQLLEAVYNSDNTELKMVEAANIREPLIKEILEFSKLLMEYNEPTILEEEKTICLNKIRRMLSVKSPFTAFKIWVIKDNSYLMNEFGEFLPKTIY